jgi:hypothetical protein
VHDIVAGRSPLASGRDGIVYYKNNTRDRDAVLTEPED